MLAALDHFFHMELLAEFFRSLVKGLIFLNLSLLFLRKWDRDRLGLFFLALLFLVALVLSTTAFLAGSSFTPNR